MKSRLEPTVYGTLLSSLPVRTLETTVAVHIFWIIIYDMTTCNDINV